MHLNSHFPALPPTPETNIHNALFRRPDQAEWTDYTAYVDGNTGKSLRFKAFLERVYDAATVLGSPAEVGGLGLTPGTKEVVGIVSENAVDYVVLVQALLALTVPFALLSSHATPFELQHSIQLTKPTRLFVDAESLPRAVKVAQEAGIAKDKIYVLTENTGAPSKGFLTFDELVQRAQGGRMKREAVREAKKKTLAFLVLSSGTSGLPKAVMITHGCLVASLYQAMYIGMALAALNPEPKQLNTPEGIPVVLGILPLHHSYGLHQFAFRCFLSPSTTVVQSKWDVEGAISAIGRHRISTLNLVPSMWHQIANSPSFAKADLSSIAVITSGAAYLPQDLHGRVMKMLPESTMFAEGYGMSEATLGVLMRPYPGLLGGKLGENDPTATGILVPGMEARIIRLRDTPPQRDDDVQEADWDEVGELWVRAETISPGYWGDEKATREAYTKDGWFRSGDLFRVNEQGYFFFSDRAKDTLKVSGSQVSPFEIENVLTAHPETLISDASVAGVSGFGRTSDEKVPRAWVVLSLAGQELERQKGRGEVGRRLQAWVRESLSRYKWLRGGVEVVDVIPKTPTGKVLRRVLVERYEAMRKEKSKL